LVTAFSHIILASASPRRKQLLEQAGIPFVVRPSDVDEDRLTPPDPSPPAVVRHLAMAKARAVAPLLADQPGALILGADTAVVLEGEMLGKPAGEEEAARMLSRLAGRTHTVYTALALVGAGGREQAAYAATRVTMRPMSPQLLAAYIATGEPMDKAGAYGIQGFGSMLVERIEGCYFNVVGLPLALLAQMLEDWNIDLPRLWRAASGRQRPERGGVR